jgi:hypothetical protein
MTRLISAVLAIVAAVYFTEAYLPVGLAYLRVRTAAWYFAHDTDAEPLTADRLVAKVRQDAGIALDPTDVHVRRQGDGAVQVKFTVPLEFPLLGAGRPMQFAIATDPQGEIE